MIEVREEMVCAELNWLEKITKRASDRCGKYGTRWRAPRRKAKCSQPPRDRDDANAMAQRNPQLINLIDRAPRRLAITGREPTLLGNELFDIIGALRDKFPETYVHLLTNGRIFAWPAFTACLAELGYPDFMLGIPVYSDDSTIYDYVVQAKSAFDQTILGSSAARTVRLRVEIRVLLHTIGAPRLPQLVEYIAAQMLSTLHPAKQ